ncbi:MAG: TolC family protein [Planctomycetes bacterium]|nr:TolC family protein [Planctomycetota bacterium]MBI3832796.1 TolC family protein [Planctomycetota bacterium]
MKRSLQRIVHALCLSLTFSGCAAPSKTTNSDPRPNVAPTSTPNRGRELSLDASQIKPMFTELSPIDLPTAIRVAAADNFDIQQARQNVEGSRGQLESTVGSVFPALVPTALFEHVEGTVRTAEGKLIGAGFNTFQPGLAIQWVINPGRVMYEIVAAKKRFYASEQQERAVILETLRLSAVQYYGLVLAQARVATAHQSVTEAEELLRITQVRLRTGTGVEADELRGKARLAERKQELLQALNAFYESSIALALTLHLDSSVTLVPKAEAVPPVQLVRDDIEIDDLLEFAVRYRPDLEKVRTLVEAVAAEKGATWWGAFGPTFQTSYQYSGITGHAENVVPGEGIPNNLIVYPLAANGAFLPNPLANGAFKEGILRGSKQLDGSRDQSYGFHDQQRAGAQVGWRFSLSAFGQLKSANATQQQAIIEAERRLDMVRAQVVSALQASRTNRELIAIADDQVVASRETLRLTEANLRVGTMTTLDVLQAEDAVTTARLHYADAVVHYNQSQINLLASVGLLEERLLTGQND